VVENVLQLLRNLHALIHPLSGGDLAKVEEPPGSTIVFGVAGFQEADY
jgi:hypothetical protein